MLSTIVHADTNMLSVPIVLDHRAQSIHRCARSANGSRKRFTAYCDTAIIFFIRFQMPARPLRWPLNHVINHEMFPASRCWLTQPCRKKLRDVASWYQLKFSRSSELSSKKPPASSVQTPPVHSRASAAQTPLDPGKRHLHQLTSVNSALPEARESVTFFIQEVSHKMRISQKEKCLPTQDQ